MSLTDVLAKCTQMSGEAIETAEEATYFLEAKLQNVFDPQFEASLQLLRSIASFCHGTLREKIQRLIVQHGARGRMMPVKLNLFRDLTHPQDSGWGKWLDKFENHEQLGAVRAFGESYTTVVANALRASRESEEATLQKWQAQFERLLKFSEQLGITQKRQLNQWVNQAKVAQQYLEAQQLMQQLENLPQKINDLDGQWRPLKKLANRLIEKANSINNNVMCEFGDKVLEELGAFADWQELFNRIIAELNGWHFAEPQFPWLSARMTKNSSLSLDNLENCSAGIERWLITMYGEQWLKTLTQLLENGLNYVLVMNGSHLDKLTAIKNMHDAWPDYLAKTVSLSLWDSVVTDLQSEVGAEVAGKLQQLKDNYKGTEDLNAELVSDYFVTVGEHITSELTAFIEEFSEIQQLQQNYQRWWQSGNMSVLSDNQFIYAQTRLVLLAKSWAGGSGFNQLHRDFQQLQHELQILGQAETLFLKAESQQALLMLSGLASPGAQALKVRIEQSHVEKDIREKMAQGRLDDISREALNQSGETIQFEYQAYRQGQQFLLRLTSDIEALNTIESLQQLNLQVIALKASKPSADERLTVSDKTQWANLQQTVQSMFDERLEAQVSQLERQVEYFPLPNLPMLMEYQQQMDEIAQIMQTDNVGEQLQAMLQNQLEPIRLILQIHQHCYEQQWSAAYQLLDNYCHINESLVKALKGTVEFYKLKKAKGEDSQWLALYREHHRLLLADTGGKKHYLRLLRHCDVTQISTTDLNVLPLECPQEIYLLSLCHCCLNPLAVDKIKGNMQPEDKELLTNLLKYWALLPERYYHLSQLWQLLGSWTQQQVWSEALSPVETLSGVIKERYEKLEDLLEKPDIDLMKLKNQMEQLYETGQIQQSVMDKLDKALKLEQRMAELERADPWVNVNLPLLTKSERDLDVFSANIRRARGWEDAIKWRREGILLWKTFEQVWREFRTEFDSSDLHFPLNTVPWQRLIEQLAFLDRHLNEFAQKLHWTVANAEQSQRWQALLNEWKNAPEGILWLKQGKVLPATPTEFSHDYQQVLVQMQAFSQLHQNLLDSFPKPSSFNAAVLSAEQQKWLGDLQNTLPISQPVAKLQAQLTDPASGLIGEVYQQFIREAGSNGEV